MNPWWAVDLGANFNVSTVIVTNRDDCCCTYSNIHVFSGMCTFFQNNVKTLMHSVSLWYVGIINIPHINLSST